MIAYILTALAVAVAVGILIGGAIFHLGDRYPRAMWIVWGADLVLIAVVLALLGVE